VVVDLLRSYISLPFHISYASILRFFSSVVDMLVGGFWSLEVFPCINFYVLAELVIGNIIVLFLTTGLGE
jgi:hypothetical protein